jgi:hypothetical protein
MPLTAEIGRRNGSLGLPQATPPAQLFPRPSVPDRLRQRGRRRQTAAPLPPPLCAHARSNSNTHARPRPRALIPAACSWRRPCPPPASAPPAAPLRAPPGPRLCVQGRGRGRVRLRRRSARCRSAAAGAAGAPNGRGQPAASKRRRSAAGWSAPRCRQEPLRGRLQRASDRSPALFSRAAAAAGWHSWGPGRAGAPAPQQRARGSRRAAAHP